MCLKAVTDIHEHNLVHRNISHQNFIFEKEDLKLIAFGFATICKEG